MCKFGRDPVICLPCLVEEAICAKSLRTDRQTDGRTDDERRAIALAHWNELKMVPFRITGISVFLDHPVHHGVRS